MSSIATRVSTNQESPTPLSSGFITMNSFNNQRNMSYKGMWKQAMPVPKLMAIENEYYRTKDTLVHEIKRLRGEVGTLAKRYNNAKQEIEDLVKRVRSQPPPPVPRRDEEVEKRIAERHEKWVEHLQREAEAERVAEKEKEKEVDSDTVMPTAEDESSEINNPLSSEQSPLDQSLQSKVGSEIETKVKSPDPTPPASDTDSDVGMEDEKPIIKPRVTVLPIYVEEGWGTKIRKETFRERWSIYEWKVKRWKESCELLAIKESERGTEGDVQEIANRVEDIVSLWYEAKRRGKFRGWGNPGILDGMLYAKMELEWGMKLLPNGMEFWEK